MKISVIIPTCNRNELLDKCLELLAPGKQTLPAIQYQVIVTDDSSANVAKSLICEKYKWAVWVEGPKRGPAANRNNGAKYAKGEWLVFTDDDCLPDLRLLEEYHDAIQSHSNVFAFEGAILPDDWSLMRKDLAECPINDMGDCFWSANICLKESLFKAVNGFDEDFKIAAQEDQFLYFQVKKISPVIFLKKARVIHPVRFGTLRKKIKNNQKAINNWFLYTQKMAVPFENSIKNGFSFQFRDLFRNATSLKAKSCLLNLYTLFVGLPILIINYAKGNK
jgi:GT2 family glycosyltransferase